MNGECNKKGTAYTSKRLLSMSNFLSSREIFTATWFGICHYTKVPLQNPHRLFLQLIKVFHLSTLWWPWKFCEYNSCTKIKITIHQLQSYREDHQWIGMKAVVKTELPTMCWLEAKNHLKSHTIHFSSFTFPGISHHQMLND
jgi:hypothetical protein